VAAKAGTYNLCMNVRIQDGLSENLGVNFTFYRVTLTIVDACSTATMTMPSTPTQEFLMATSVKLAATNLLNSR